jgi:hypothetical protein
VECGALHHASSSGSDLLDRDGDLCRASGAVILDGDLCWASGAVILDGDLCWAGGAVILDGDLCWAGGAVILDASGAVILGREIRSSLRPS